MTKAQRKPNDQSPSASVKYPAWDEGNTKAAVLREDQRLMEKAYDLEERTALFGEAIIRFAKKIPQGPVNNRLIAQLIGAGTSVGANYFEADDGVSKKDFRNKIGTCRKEAKELYLIFCTIYRK